MGYAVGMGTGGGDAVNEFGQTPQSADWFARLADKKAKGRIRSRIVQAMVGLFGDCAPVGEGVSEMRIHYGPGYRVYFAREGATVYLLLAGGDKSSQRRDIAEAKAIWTEAKKGKP